MSCCCLTCCSGGAAWHAVLLGQQLQHHLLGPLAALGVARDAQGLVMGSGGVAVLDHHHLHIGALLVG